MDESKPRERRRSKPIKEQSFPISPFGHCVIALARGIKPAQWLSDRVKRHGGKCTERHANLLIAGKRKPSARAVLAVNAEMLG